MGDIRDMITNSEINPQNLDLTQITNMLYENRHFNNLLGDLLTKKASSTKLEKFFTNQVKEKLKEISLDLQIANSFNNINQRIQDRLNKLRNTKFEPKVEDLE